MRFENILPSNCKGPNLHAEQFEVYSFCRKQAGQWQWNGKMWDENHFSDPGELQ